MAQTAAEKQQELANLIKAKFSVIYITTTEERRVQAAIMAVGEALKMDVYLWSIVSGMLKIGDKETVECNDPTQALTFINEAKGRGIFVLRDFDPYIEPTPGNVGTIRMFRELADDLANAKKDNARAVIILATRLTLPDQLRAATVVMDWPLPDRPELQRTVEAVNNALPSELRTEMPKGKEPLVKLYSEVALAAQGLTLAEAQNAFALSAIKYRAIKPVEISAYKRQAVARGGLLEWIEPEGGMELIGGLEVLKQWLVERKEGFSDEARAYGLPLPKGLLLGGVPGGGKSASAKAASNAWGVPILRWDVGRTFGKYQGDTEGQGRQVIAMAEATAPCILWIDEIEKGMSGMGGSGETDGGSANRLFQTFLTWMQEKKSAVFVFATANNADVLPAELMRKGRFDEIFFVDLPNEVEREQIWKVHIGKRKRDVSKFDLPELIELSTQFTGAEIETVFVDAMFRAFSTRTEVTQDHVREVLKATKPLSVMMPEKVDRIRAWAKGRARLASLPVGKTVAETSRFAEMDNN